MPAATASSYQILWACPLMLCGIMVRWSSEPVMTRTMLRYALTGMGNRFAGLAEYHQLILVHGIFAAITFLAVVPAAIFIARFYHRNPRLALRMHIWLQITTLFLATVVLILGWFAVGPARSLSNPHHGIGIAIYTLIMAQFLFGWLIHAREKGKVRDHIPLKLFVRSRMPRHIGLCSSVYR